MYMDREKNRRRQNLRVIISEAIMVLVVIITVTILAFIVSGYWLNADFKVERQGMLQIASIPTGADVMIDNENPSWFQRTNTSKILPSGEHTITIAKEGYDSWSKTINISEGLLYRIHYPRLFLQNRSSEDILDIAGSTLATISPDRETLILINQTTDWLKVDLRSQDLKVQKVDISAYFPGVSLADGATTGVFTGEISDINWDRSGDHILFKLQAEGETEWVLLDVFKTDDSVNLSREFQLSFDEVEILDDSSNNLLTLQNGDLRRIDVPKKVITETLVEQVIDFDHYENEIVFSALNQTEYQIGRFKLGDEEAKILTTSPTPVQVAISKFYDDMYITLLEADLVSLYAQKDFLKLSDYQLSFTPEELKVGHHGEFITFRAGTMIATLDMESRTVREWQVEGSQFGWIDNDMIYSVADGKLIVYDFDGLNRRVIAENVSGRFPAAITKDKWLYYFSDEILKRETIAN